MSNLKKISIEVELRGAMTVTWAGAKTDRQAIALLNQLHAAQGFGK